MQGRTQPRRSWSAVIPHSPTRNDRSQLGPASTAGCRRLGLQVPTTTPRVASSLATLALPWAAGKPQGRSECGGKAQFRNLARGWLRWERRPASAIARARARELESTVLSRRDSARLRFPARYGRMYECLRLSVRNFECIRHLGTTLAQTRARQIRMGGPSRLSRALSRVTRQAHGGKLARANARARFFFFLVRIPSRAQPLVLTNCQRAACSIFFEALHTVLLFLYVQIDSHSMGMARDN